MTINDFSRTLKGMYEGAPRGDRVAMIHLFGIKYADEIRESEYSPRDILKSARMHESYATEISKGMKLSKYVEEK